MARIAFKAAVQPVGFSATYAVDPAGKIDDTATLITAAKAAAALVTADATVAGDPTALGLSGDSEAAILAAEVANTAAGASAAEDVVVSINATDITKISQLEAALRAIVQEARNSGAFAA